MIAIEERLRHNAEVQPNYTIDVYPGDVLEVIDAARAEAAELRAAIAQAKTDGANEERSLHWMRENTELRNARAEAVELRDELCDCQNRLQDWQVAAGTRQSERDAARAEAAELRAVVVKLSEELGVALRERDELRAANDPSMSALAKALILSK